MDTLVFRDALSRIETLQKLERRIQEQLKNKEARPYDLMHAVMSVVPWDSPLFGESVLTVKDSRVVCEMALTTIGIALKREEATLKDLMKHASA